MSRPVVASERGSVRPFELVLSRLPEAKPVAGSSNKAWKARCPAHDDADPSLSITLGDKTAVQQAAAWLQDALADGPLPSADVLTRAKAQDISRRTLERAKESLGVRSDRKSGQGTASWYFELPAMCGIPRQVATP